jgi:membrane-associated phospholipid phosphatase
VFGAVVVGLVLLGHRWAAVVVALPAVGSGELYFFLERLVARPRPSADLVRVAGPLPMTGFPSGHAATFTAVFGFAAFLAYRRMGPPAARWATVALVAVQLNQGQGGIYMGGKAEGGRRQHGCRDRLWSGGWFDSGV